MSIYQLLSTAFQYPAAGMLEKLEAGIQTENISKNSDFNKFVKEISKLSLSEWEELYTYTLDLNPAVAPYVGFQMWGENYKRGSFLSHLNREFFEADVELFGELPDHLAPILLYLEISANPLPELVEVLPQALDKMITILKKENEDNPYLHLFKATLSVVDKKPVKS